MKIIVMIAALILLAALSSRADVIHDAAREGDQARVENLLERDPELIRSVNERRATPLHLACDGGHAALAGYLLSRGADIEAADVDGDTPLHWAAYAGHCDVAELLLEKGADIEAKNSNEQTPLHYAVLRNQKNMAGFLVDRGADMAAGNYEGYAALHMATLGSNREIIHLLIEKGADLEIGDSRNRTPLLLVARETGNAYIARMLIQRGADVNAVDLYGETPLMLATWRGFDRLVEIFLDSGATFEIGGRAGRNLIMDAAGRRVERIFTLMAERGVDMAFRTDSGGSLLHAAAAGGSKEIVELLIGEGLAIDDADRYGWQPLHYAAYRDRTEAADLLIEKGADVDARTLAGRTPLNLASARGHTPVIERLKAAGADEGPVRFPDLEGAYVGQSKTGPGPEVFALDVISMQEREHCCVSFSPDGSAAYWSASFVISDQGYTDGGIMSTRLENGRWTPPEFAFFSQSLEFDDDAPFCTSDGKRIYFLSRRPLQPGVGLGKENVWFVEKSVDGWGAPRPAGRAVNAKDVHWQISVSNDYTLCFHSGQDGICCSRYVDGEYAEPVPLANPAGDNFAGGSPFIAADESYIIFSDRREGGLGSDDLYITFKDREGNWTRPVNMGPEINSAGGERCPIVSHDGRYIFLLSSRHGAVDIYWAAADVIDRLKSAAPGL
jgi:ankyrin repeat protein